MDIRKQLKNLNIDKNLKDFQNIISTTIKNQSDYIRDLQNELQ